MTHPMHYIADNTALQQAGEYWLTLPALGIDTEFIRTDTFHPIPALIQISDGQQSWLVDVLHVQDFSPLKSVLVKPSIIKIVHAAGEDLEVFDRLFGVLPDALFDTQIAASFCGHGSSIGYSKLVQAILSIEISKDQCRSDWLARPLTAEQTHYASLDVLHLPALHQHLHNLLVQRERADWAEEENLRQIERYREQRDASYNIDRINNAWRLDETERLRLWHLLLGRDALARQHNKPRNHIAKDFALFEMARRPPKHVAELSAIEGFKPSGIRQFGAHLIQLAQDVPADLICPIIAEPLGRAENARMKQLRARVDSLAASMDLPVEILARKQELEQLVRHHANQQDIKLPARFTGWRDTVISQPLLDEINAW